MLYEIRDGSVSQQGEPVLSHFDFGIRGTEKIAIVGRNGAGKSTLLEAIAGEKEIEINRKNPASGVFRSRAFTVGVLRQQACENPDETVEDCILKGVKALWIEKGEILPAAMMPEENMPVQGMTSGAGSDVQGMTPEGNIAAQGKAPVRAAEDIADSAGLYSRERYDFEQRYDRIFTGFGFSLEDKRKKLGEFSGGEQTKICLIRLLLEEPDVLVLDEPTNHLDLAAVEWLEKYLRAYPKAVVCVSHDRYFLDQTAEVVWEVSGGHLTRYAGGYTAYRTEKQKRAAKAAKAYEEQQAEIARLSDLIRKFRGKPRKASFARSRAKILERMDRMEKPDADEAVIHTGAILPARPGSRWAVECEDLKIGYDHPIRELSLRIRRGQKIGIIGPNGTGKSTFLKTVAGLLPPIAGKNKIGESVDLAYFDQMTARFTSDKTVIDWFHDQFPAMEMGETRRVLAGFLFRGEDCGKPVAGLSGGEKARLMLAAILERRPNFLVMDEPTNNMDIPAKETLESIFRCYQGTILFVSHDRYFLSQVAEALLVFEPETDKVLYYPGNYRHYKERKDRVQAGVDTDLLRTAEEQRLIEGLRSVPKGEKGMLRRISDAEQEFDWRFAVNRTGRETAEQAFAEALERAEYADAERARDIWTRTLLDWYDIWLDREAYRHGVSAPEEGMSSEEEECSAQEQNAAGQDGRQAGR